MMRRGLGWRVAALLFTLFALAPVIVVFSLSLREHASLLEIRHFIPPARPSLVHYREVLAEPGFARAGLNSILVAALTIAGNVVLAAAIAFAMTRQTSVGLRAMMVSLVFAIALPQQATIVPMFLLFQRWSLLDTFTGIVLPGLVMPINVLLLFHAIRAIPRPLLDAAEIDGAEGAYAFRHVILPLISPTLGVVALNSFMASWSAFLLPFLLTTTAEHRTLPVALALLKTQDEVRWPLVIAGAMVTALPIVIVFLVARRRIMTGVMAGGVKG